MNAQSKWLSGLLGIGAILEVPVGLALLIVPSPFVLLLLGEPLAGTGLVAGRLAGGGLLALGIACWFARATPATRASLGVAGALLVYNIIACITLALVTPTLFLPLLASVLHGLMAAALAGALVVNRQ